MMVEYTNITKDGTLSCPICGKKRSITSLKRHLTWDCNPPRLLTEDKYVYVPTRLTPVEIESYRNSHPEICFIAPNKKFGRPRIHPVETEVVPEPEIRKLSEQIIREILAKVKLPTPPIQFNFRDKAYSIVKTNFDDDTVSLLEKTPGVSIKVIQGQLYISYNNRIPTEEEEKKIRLSIVREKINEMFDYLNRDEIPEFKTKRGSPEWREKISRKIIEYRDSEPEKDLSERLETTFKQYMEAKHV